MRLIDDEQDIVYRFQQMQNLGPYMPTRQGPELIDRDELARRKLNAEDEATKQKFPLHWESLAYVYGRKELRRELELAKQKVERLNSALTSNDLDALESFLQSTSCRDTPFDCQDALASDAAKAFVKHADTARISAALKNQPHRITFWVKRTHEQSLASKRGG
jgi:hypothetical protein